MKWNKYRSQMTIQPQNNNFNYLIDPTFTNVNRFFVLSFTRDNAGDNRDSLSHYYGPNVERKDFNVLIDRKSLSKMKNTLTKKLSKWVTIMIIQTGNLLDFAYFKKKTLQINCNWFEWAN